LNRFLVLLFLVCTCAFQVQAQQTNSPAPILISAHRGNTGRAPENTLATYKDALKVGVEYIEIDVRTTLDGELVILHDATLNRTTNAEGPLKNKRFAELSELSAGKGFIEFDKERIPTLEEVCQLISRWNFWHKKKTYIYVDCKDVAPAHLVETLVKYKLAYDSYFYGNDSFLLSLKQVLPQARLMPSLRNKEEIQLKIASLHPAAFDASFLSLTQEMVDEIHSKNIRVFTDLLGPIDTETNYKKAAKLGVDLIQTDKPKLVLETLHH
jgi:glycerophosphoryl diester phosphodiesterase